MDGRDFDELTKIVASVRTRRQFVAWLAGGVAGGLLGLSRRNHAAAACRAAGRTCREDGNCCSKLCASSSGRRRCVCPADTRECDGACIALDACCTDDECAAFGDQCSRGVCDAATGGCYAKPLNAGTACDDGNPCTTASACDGNGRCVGLSDVECPAPTAPCQAPGVCNPATGGCDYGPQTSGIVCRTSTDQCRLDAECDGANLDCPDHPIATGRECDDDNACTTGDTCQADGSCAGQQIDCDDDLECTDDDCDSASGCFHTVRSGTCLIDGTCYEFGRRNPNNRCQHCDPSQHQTAWTNLPKFSSCSDENLCNGDESCDGNGACLAGVPVTCPDPLPCQEGPGECISATGACRYALQQKDTVCRAASSQCQADAVCDGVNPDCPANPNANGKICDDGNACTEGETCLDGVCQGGKYLFDFDCPVCMHCSGSGGGFGCDVDPNQIGKPCGGDPCAPKICSASGQCVVGSPVRCRDCEKCVDGECVPDPEKDGMTSVEGGWCCNGVACLGNCCSGGICCDGECCPSGTCCSGGRSCEGGTCQSCLGVGFRCDPDDNQCCQFEPTACPASPARCCRPPGSACSDIEQCCDGDCVGGKCCLSYAHWDYRKCTKDEHCCSGVCDPGAGLSRCCERAGTACTFDQQCCSFSCVDGKCR
jgi:hypothetical protein